MTKPQPLQYETYYHIFNRGNNGETLFRSKDNYLHFLKLYGKHFYLQAETFAYCLLPNHFHFLVRIKSHAEIEEANVKTLRVSQTLRVSKQQPSPSQAFGNVCNAYTKSINKAYGRTGSLFENPFGRIPVTNAAYFTTLITYIHRNPQKHGIVDEFRDWPYSSYDAILHAKPTRVCATAVLDWYGGVNQFKVAHQTDPDATQLPTYFDPI